MKALLLLLKHADTGVAVSKRRRGAKGRNGTLLTVFFLVVILSLSFRGFFSALPNGREIAVAQLTLSGALLALGMGSELFFQLQPGPRLDLLRTLPVRTSTVMAFFLIESLLQSPLFLALTLCLVFSLSSLSLDSLLAHALGGIWYLGVVCLVAVGFSSLFHALSRLFSLKWLPWVMNLASLLLFVLLMNGNKLPRSSSEGGLPPAAVSGASVSGLFTPWNPAFLAGTLPSVALPWLFWTAGALALGYWGLRPLRLFHPPRASVLRTGSKGALAFSSPLLKRHLLSLLRSPSQIYLLFWPLGFCLVSVLTSSAGSASLSLPVFLVMSIPGALVPALSADAESVVLQQTLPYSYFRSIDVLVRIWVVLEVALSVLGGTAALAILFFRQERFPTETWDALRVALVVLPGIVWGVSWMTASFYYGHRDVLLHRSADVLKKWSLAGLTLGISLLSTLSLLPAFLLGFREPGRGRLLFWVLAGFVLVGWVGAGLWARARARRRLEERIQDLRDP